MWTGLFLLQPELDIELAVFIVKQYRDLKDQHKWFDFDRANAYFKQMFSDFKHSVSDLKNNACFRVSLSGTKKLINFADTDFISNFAKI